MSMLEENVVQFKSNEIYGYFETFIHKKGAGSENTARNYKASITEFLEFLGTDIKHVTEDELMKVQLDDFDKYIHTLKKKYKLANSTIMNRSQGIQSFFRYLKANKVKVDTDYFPYITKLKDTTEEYGKLTVDEVLQMAEIAKEDKNMGKVKYYLIMFALETGLRLDELLNLKWKNIRRIENKIIVQILTKGTKKHKIEIGEKIYSDILTLKEKDSEYVFNISEKTVNRLMKKLREKMNFDKDRKIVFHSIRKAALTHCWHTTNDPLAVMKMGNHSDFNTTKKYIQEETYGAIGFVTMQNETDLDILDSLSKEQLLEIIKNSSKSIQLILAKNSKELI